MSPPSFDGFGSATICLQPAALFKNLTDGGKSAFGCNPVANTSEDNMDSSIAANLASELIGKTVEGWTINSLIDNGKSAAVFKAQKGNEIAAIKVFDSALIEKFGDNTQLARIHREIELVGKHHDNLVKILGGGHDDALSIYYIIMEFLDGPNLKKFLPSVASNQVGDFISQLAAAAKYLEDNGLAHRDIKPENIVIMDSKRLVLLDLGVIRPIGISDITDPDGLRAFIGTLQYSSPEFLLREETQDKEGFRALTFYQIGAVLHDLIMQKPIFAQFAEPYAKLVNAVQFERPTIVSEEVPARLIHLAESCLLKNPAARLQSVAWSSFFAPEGGGAQTAKSRIAQRMETFRAQNAQAEPATKVTLNANALSENILKSLQTAAITARASVAGLPPLTQRPCDKNECYEFVFDKSGGFSQGLALKVAIKVIDPEEQVVSCFGCAFRMNVEPQPGLDQLTPWFTGRLDNAPLLLAFEQFFFSAIEWGLQVESLGTANFAQIFQPTKA